MKLPQRKTVLAAVTATLVAASALVVAGPATAAPLDPGNEVDGGAYTITHTPTERSGFWEDAGEWWYILGPDTTSISTGCPEGFRAASRTIVVAPDGTETVVGLLTRTVDGAPIELTDSHRAEFGTLFATAPTSGTYRFVITCEASAPEAGAPIGSARYFASDIEFDFTAHTWKLIEKPGGGPEKAATTTSLSASAITATSTTLTATVDAPAATGTVTFLQNGTAIGQPVAVGSGVAVLPVTGLSPATAYEFTAAYSGDEKHEASVSAARPVTTLPSPPGGTPGDTDGTDVIVDVPPPGGQGGLTISTAPNSVVLSGGLREAGKDWTATGTLETVTVIDDRRNASAGAWSLSGASSAFTSGGNSFPASTFGWTPQGLTGAGQAGAPATDLSSAKPLASGAASAASEVMTSVKAGLSLTVPSGTPGGDYTAKLTLTLI